MANSLIVPRRARRRKSVRGAPRNPGRRRTAAHARQWFVSRAEVLFLFLARLVVADLEHGPRSFRELAIDHRGRRRRAKRLVAVAGVALDDRHRELATRLDVASHEATPSGSSSVSRYHWPCVAVAAAACARGA